MPYYWNIAPNRDATFTFVESTARGPAVDGEFRYLQPGYSGEVELRCCRNDRAYDGHSRHALRFSHEGLLPGDVYAQARVQRVSDDDYWKDFPAIAARRRRACCRPTCSSTGRSATGRPTPACSAGRCCRPPTRRPGSTRRPTSALPQVGARYAAPWRGGFDVGLRGRVQPLRQPGRPLPRLAPDGRPRSMRSAASAGRSTRPAGRWCPRSRSTPPRTRSTSRCADGRRSASRADADAQRRQRLGLGARHHAVRQGVPPDPRAAPVLRQHAVSRARTTCRTSTPRPRTSTSTRSSPRTRSPASTASPTRTS